MQKAPAIKQKSSGRLPRQKSVSSVAEMRAKQSSKIRELGIALADAGIFGLDEQARLLRLPRSTTWTILRGNHKGSNLSGAVINRMLAAPQLPVCVRKKILEYIEEKVAGCYGDSPGRLRRFDARLSGSVRRTVHVKTTQKGASNKICRNNR